MKESMICSNISIWYFQGKGWFAFKNYENNECFYHLNLTTFSQEATFLKQQEKQSQRSEMIS